MWFRRASVMWAQVTSAKIRCECSTFACIERINFACAWSVCRQRFRECFLETVSFTHRYQVGKSSESGNAFTLGRVVFEPTLILPLNINCLRLSSLVVESEFISGLKTTDGCLNGYQFTHKLSSSYQFTLRKKNNWKIWLGLWISSKMIVLRSLIRKQIK